MSSFEPVIGLEVHAQLSTSSKLFCRCSTAFGLGPNAAVCPVCAGHPGALPVLNARAVEYAVRAGLALRCRVNEVSVFARKNYFYPDMPKAYQISQYERPLCEDGFLDIEAPAAKRVRVQRIHMEEDAGKLVHAHGRSLVNLNRAGTPLIEIVSHPDMRSSAEAGAYLRKLRQILMYLGVNDGNMQEGSLRCDANVSVRPRGEEKLYTRVEIKNVNSFRFLEKAIDYEVSRQTQVVLASGRVAQETRGFDSGKGVTYSMRSKEEAQDYRYFPDPDLPPLLVGKEQLALAEKTLPELPDAKRARYVEALGLGEYEAKVITDDLFLARFFEEVASACGDGKLAANWVMGELLKHLKAAAPAAGGEDAEAAAVAVTRIPVGAQSLARLIALVKEGVINNNTAKAVFEEMFTRGAEPDAIVKEKGLAQVSDEGALAAEIDRVLAANAAQVAEYRAGKDKVYGFIVGQVMKAMAGKANPAVVNKILKAKLSR